MALPSLTNAQTGHIKIIYNFSGLDGEGEGAFPVIFDAAGNLYGTTTGFGSDGLCGNVYELSPDGAGHWIKQTLYTFTCGSEGGSPSEMVLDAAGNLYGTTADG